MTTAVALTADPTSLERVEQAISSCLVSSHRPRIVPHLNGHPIDAIQQVSESAPLRVDVVCMGQQYTLTAITSLSSDSITARTTRGQDVYLTFEPPRAQLPIGLVLAKHA